MSESLFKKIQRGGKRPGKQAPATGFDNRKHFNKKINIQNKQHFTI